MPALAPQDDPLSDEYQAAAGDTRRCKHERCEHGFIFTLGDSTVCYPCRNCRPALFARWCQGHLAADHECEECEDLRVGRRSQKQREKNRERWKPDEGDERKDLA